MKLDYHDISKMIDHAILTPTMNQAEIDAGIELAIAFDVASVCIMPYLAAYCAERLANSDVMASTVIGFPHGTTTTSTKCAETVAAIQDGCREVDMVVNQSLVKCGRWSDVSADIAAVKRIAHDSGVKLKVIFENSNLADVEKIELCNLCGEISVDWVKTSTGFAGGGATQDDVRLMRRHTPAHVQVKASGAVRDYATLLTMRELGATRIGASATAAILNACRESLGLPSIEIKPQKTIGY